MRKKLSPTASHGIQGKVVVPSPITANVSQFLPLTASLPSGQVGKSSYQIGFSGISLVFLLLLPIMSLISRKVGK